MIQTGIYKLTSSVNLPHAAPSYAQHFADNAERNTTPSLSPNKLHTLKPKDAALGNLNRLKVPFGAMSSSGTASRLQLIA